jgi:hypothetical protein
VEPFVDHEWLERAASELRLLDPMLSDQDAADIARALAMQPAWRVAGPVAVISQTFLREGRGHPDDIAPRRMQRRNGESGYVPLFEPPSKL